MLEHQAVLKLAGSPDQGQAVFKKQCANCHKLDDVGYEIGPNLRSLTDDGRTLTGMIASETGNSITLVEKENKQHVILRSQVEDIRSTGMSLIPEGLEKDITHQEFADLISYIRMKDSKQ